MNYLAHGEFQLAIENLHRYFDYAVQLAHTMHSLEDSSPDTKSPSLLPYATLNLAGVHFRFGNYSYATHLIHETVSFLFSFNFLQYNNIIK